MKRGFSILLTGLVGLVGCSAEPKRPLFEEHPPAFSERYRIAEMQPQPYYQSQKSTYKEGPAGEYRRRNIREQEREKE